MLALAILASDDVCIKLAIVEEPELNLAPTMNRAYSFLRFWYFYSLPRRRSYGFVTQSFLPHVGQERVTNP